ncbi:hypothetical protein BV22DRAFT_612696 [Leucogyrophana mollusca]|uniref:Uncharacterized protein n=1 Tax=Leucogyrophana mollusca TaxID=85980 RepID=A0ACB8BD09_9AGAM|nr:hypothetical protein BV22DRAFT_612696 [Leucogyrophana mollusca]
MRLQTAALGLLPLATLASAGCSPSPLRNATWGLDVYSATSCASSAKHDWFTGDLKPGQGNWHCAPCNELAHTRNNVRSWAFTTGAPGLWVGWFREAGCHQKDLISRELLDYDCDLGGQRADWVELLLRSGERLGDGAGYGCGRAEASEGDEGGLGASVYRGELGLGVVGLGGNGVRRAVNGGLSQLMPNGFPLGTW